MACPLCEAKSPRYDWGLVCCLSRFVAGQPTQDHRRMWVERIRRAVGTKDGNAVESDARRKYRMLREVRLRGGAKLRSEITPSRGGR